MNCFIKNLVVPLLLAVGICEYAQAERAPEKPRDLAPNAKTNRKEKELEYAIAERGPNHRVWAKVTWETNAVGRVKAVTNSYTELATGMHFKNKKGDWEESREEIEILPNNAGAVADKGQHKVIFPPEIKSGIIELQTPDGKWMRSRVWGLAYFDTATGESVLLAEVQESEGKLVGDNIVIYPNAFTDFVADIRYTYMRAGFEQDVVLRENPPSPEELGLNPQTTRLQVLTEFVEAPQPQKSRRKAGMLADEALAFGKMSIGQGKAFAVDGQGKASKRLPVAKQWGQLEGRDFLVEEVPYGKVIEQLQKLPPARKYKGASLQRRGKGESVLVGLKQLAPKRYAKTTPEPSSKPKRMAKAKVDQSPAFVMDYITVTTQTDYTFKGDTTYYVSGVVSFSGTVILEGGAVIKYALFSSTYPAPTIGVGTLVCKTDSYRPAIFTAKDDNSVGETISGSTGTPSLVETYGDGYLQIEGQMVENVRMSYGEVGIRGVGNWTVRNAQFNQCYLAMSGNPAWTGGADVRVQNVLIKDSTVGFQIDEGGFSIENMTAYQVNSFLEDSLGAGIYANLTNCLLVAVADWGQPFTSINNATNSSSSVFQTVGAGAHYLASNSPYRNVGTTNIDATLLASLKKKTTYPPLILTNTITANTTLSPQAQRDTDLPDLGYHYDPIDYWAACQVTNATVTLTNGVIVGYYREYGFWLHNNSRLISTGSPTARNQFIHYSLVQEQPVLLSPYSLNSSMAINPYHTEQTSNPEVLLDFTTFKTVQGANYLLYEGYGDWNLNRLEVRNCEFYGPDAYMVYETYGGATNTTCRFNNNLIDALYSSFVTEGGSGLTYELRNNLFLAGSVDIYDFTAPIWLVKDNAFDGQSAYIDGDISHNAYLNGTVVYATLQASDVVATNFTWVAGPLGDYYQYSTNLLNQGSQTADLAGLYHYTVLTNLSGGLQIKETNSVVDIGYHYVAVNTNGQPIDSDGDGVPDYVEDADGDGVFEPIAGETVWNCFPPPSGMIAWWAAENNGLDSVGDAHAVMLNGANFGIGKVGLAFNFDGTNDRVVASNSAHLNMGSGADFSMECWIKGYTNATDYGVMTLLSKRYSPNVSTTLGYELYLWNGNLGLRMDDPSNKYAFNSTTPDLRDGQLHHVAVTVDRDSSTGGGKIYVDGAVVYTFNPTVCPGDLSNSEPFRIGNHPTLSLNCYFKGMIDEPAVYNRVLTATEIGAIYTAGASGKCTEGDGIYDGNFRVQITRPKSNSIIP